MAQIQGTDIPNSMISTTSTPMTSISSDGGVIPIDDTSDIAPVISQPTTTGSITHPSTSTTEIISDSIQSQTSTTEIISDSVIDQQEETTTVAGKRKSPSATSTSNSSIYNRLDEQDVIQARTLGLLCQAIEVCSNPTSSEYGIAYEKRGGSKVTGCGTEVYPSQKALQERCKQFAMERGFQLYVAGSSSRADGGGNVKYKCKKLHGQQFYDPDTSFNQLECPFYINGYGLGPAWKTTKLCLIHNHYKFIGIRTNETTREKLKTMDPIMINVDETFTIPMEPKIRAQRNTTLSTSVLCRMVNEELDRYPSSNIAMSKVDGKLIKRILLSRGHVVNHMMASRIKRQIQMHRMHTIRLSFQQLEHYFQIIINKNPQTYTSIECDEHQVFQRAICIPHATLHVFQRCPKILGLDHILPGKTFHPCMETDEIESEGDSDDAIAGTYLYATTKDYNDHVIVIGVALVAIENTENWIWFLHSLQTAASTLGYMNWNDYTIFAGRTHGLQPALQTMWPGASHHICLRRIIEEEIILIKKIPLSEDKKQCIYAMAQCENETEYKHLRQELALTHEAVIHHLDTINRMNWVKYAFLETFKKPTFGIVSADLMDINDILSLRNETELIPKPLTNTRLYQYYILNQWFGSDHPRSSQPLQVFARYFMKIAENFHLFRSSVQTRPLHELVPQRFTQLEQHLQASQRCESVPCANGTYMVRSLSQMSSLQSHDTWRHVNLLDRECTCLEWQDRLFPCVHAIHAAELSRRRIDSLYHTSVYTVQEYKTCYEIGFTPWPIDAITLQVNKEMKIAMDELYQLDPSIKRKPGPRPKIRKLLVNV